MNRQKCKYTKQRIFSAATLYKTAEAHTCTGTVALTHISPAVHTCCRMAVRICFREKTETHTTKSTMKRIYKSIIIYLLRDSNQ
jgi:hypothetical protein